jgi:hypothetical protein
MPVLIHNKLTIRISDYKKHLASAGGNTDNLDNASLLISWPTAEVYRPQAMDTARFCSELSIQELRGNRF